MSLPATATVTAVTVAAAEVVTRAGAPARPAGQRQFSTAPPSTVSTVPVTKLLSIR